MSGKISKRNLFASAFAILTVGTMALFFNLYEPWRPIGPELIPDGSFSTADATNAWSGWNNLTRLVPDGGINGSPGAVLTVSGKEHGILRFTLYDLTNIPAFRVSMRAAAEEVVKGDEGYHIPRAVFFYHDAKAKSLFGVHHGVMDIPEDTGWRYYKDFFPVPQGAANARLHIQNLGNAGTMRIDDVSVIPVCGRPSAPWWKLFFGTLWITAFGICFFALKPWVRRHGWPITVTTLIILAGIVMPGEILDRGIEQTYALAKTAARRIHPPKPEVPAPAVSGVKPAPPVLKPAKPKEEPPLLILPSTGVDQAHRTGHFALFSLLAVFCSLSWIAAPSVLRRSLTVFAGLVLFAAATEVLQFITADRAAALSDLRTDTTGMAGAVILVLSWRGIQRLINRD